MILLRTTSGTVWLEHNFLGRYGKKRMRVETQVNMRYARIMLRNVNFNLERVRRYQGFKIVQCPTEPQETNWGEKSMVRSSSHIQIDRIY